MYQSEPISDHQPEDHQAKPPKPRCDNCGKKLKNSFKFCPKCGQRITTHKVSLGVLLVDMFREELHLNNKAIRTIRRLLTRPGSLTQAYIAGKKKSMISPTKLFFWTGFLFTALLLPSIEGLDIRPDGGGPINIKFDEGTEASLDSTDKPIKRYFAESSMRANEHPEQFLEHSLTKIPFVLLILIPGFAGFLKLLYFRKNVFYLEHVVFLLHLHVFVFLLFSFFLGLRLLAPVEWTLPGVWLGGIYLYFILSFRNVYQHRWAGTIFKGSLIFMAYLLTVPLLLLIISLLWGLLL